MPSTVKHYTLTLTGLAQRLSDAFGDGVGTINPANDIPCAALFVQPDGANAGAVYFGGPALTAADHGFSMPAGAAGVPPTPQKIELGANRIKLSELYVFGTATQKVHLTLVPY